MSAIVVARLVELDDVPRRRPPTARPRRSPESRAPRSRRRRRAPRRRRARSFMCSMRTRLADRPDHRRRIAPADRDPVHVDLELHGRRQSRPGARPTPSCPRAARTRSRGCGSRAEAVIREERGERAQLGGEPADVGDGLAVGGRHPRDDDPRTADGSESIGDGGRVRAQPSMPSCDATGRSPASASCDARLGHAPVGDRGELDRAVAGRRRRRAGCRGGPRRARRRTVYSWRPIWS